MNKKDRKNSQSPMISVIVPVYNAEAYIKHCLESIVSQTYVDIELIIVNDGSNDKSEEHCRYYTKKYNFIKLINSENMGVSSARNLGIDKATGEYVLFVDADDYLCSPKVLERLMKCHESSADVDVFRISTTKGARTYHFNFPIGLSSFKSTVWKLVVNEELNSSFNKLFRREIINRYNIRFPIGIKIGEDLIFNAEYFKHVEDINYIRDKFYAYRTDTVDSATKRHHPRLSYDLKKARQALWSLAFTRKSLTLCVATLFIKFKNHFSILRRYLRFSDRV